MQTPKDQAGHFLIRSTYGYDHHFQNGVKHLVKIVLGWLDGKIAAHIPHLPPPGHGISPWWLNKIKKRGNNLFSKYFSLELGHFHACSQYYITPLPGHIYHSYLCLDKVTEVGGSYWRVAFDRPLFLSPLNAWNRYSLQQIWVKLKSCD